MSPDFFIKKGYAEICVASDFIALYKFLALLNNLQAPASYPILPVLFRQYRQQASRPEELSFHHS